MVRKIYLQIGRRKIHILTSILNFEIDNKKNHESSSTHGVFRGMYVAIPFKIGDDDLLISREFMELIGLLPKST